MDKVLGAIEAALEDKKMKAAVVSEMATGSASTIRNWKLQQAKGRSRQSTIDNLEAIAEVLDLEFYFGPKRAAPDAPLEVRAIDGDVVVVPYHETMIRYGFAPMHLAVDRTWIAKTGANLDALRLLSMQSTAMDPTIADKSMVIIDTSDTEPKDGESALFGILIKSSGPTICRLTRMGEKWLVTFDNPHFVKQIAHVETPAQRLAHVPIGRVVAILSRV